MLSKTWCDLANEPKWYSDKKYRPKPKPAKLTAKIVSNKPMTFNEYLKRIQDWEFYGTPEEYCAECEKYGYIVVGEITEVVEKPKTVRYYFATVEKNCAAKEGFAYFMAKMDSPSSATLKKGM